MFKQSKIEILRDSINKVTQILSQSEVRVTQIGTSAYVTRNSQGVPQTVNLPYLPDSASDELLSAIQGFVDHEVSHVLFSDHKSAMKAKLKGEKIETLYGYFNDAFSEGKMREAFRGSSRNLGELASFHTDRRLKKRWEELEEAGASEKERLGSMMSAVTRAWSGDVFYEDFMSDKWGELSTVLDKVPQSFIDSLKNINSSEEAYSATETFLKYVEADDEPEGDDGDDGDESEGEGGGTSVSLKSDGGESDGESAGSAGSGEDESEDESEDEGEGSGEGEDEDESEDESEDEGESESKDDKGDGGGKEKPGGGGVGDDDPFARGLGSKSDMAEELNKAIDEELDGSNDYIALTTEFDRVYVAPTLAQSRSFGEERYLQYLGKECTESSQLSNEESVAKLHEEAVTDVGAASKKLEKAFVSQNRTYYEPGKRAGRLNPSSLFKLKTGDDRVFRKKVDIRAKNTAVSLVIDQSGSMSSHEKLKKAAIAAYALAEVLTRLKIPFEIIGFTTGGYANREELSHHEHSKAVKKLREQTGRGNFSREGQIIWNTYKTFDERFEYEQKSRMAAAYEHQVAMSSNADAESIEYCAGRLAKRPELRKCLIVLSDGQPACAGDPKHQRSELKKTIKRIERSGMDVVGLGICSEAVKNYYGRYIVFHDPSEIAGHVISELSRMLMETA